METSIQSVCNAMARSQLLSPAEVRTLYQRWRAEVTATDDVEQFRRWLVANEYLTEFQAERLLRGQCDNFILNQYKVLDRIGKGRMAGVYKAVHRLGQVVAIKILPPSRARNSQFFARFQREARLAKRLKHPNVVRTFQTAVAAEELYYIVMEYLEGETLNDVLQRRRRLPPDEAVRLIHQVLMGLQHIHEQGMVHRDLEPGNLMLVPAVAPGQADTTLEATVKILDIGLGRAVFDDSVPAAGGLNLTMPGTILGTPEYMAPEQAKDPHSVDIRADVYSVGCILYHCLAGQPPFPEKQMVQALLRHAMEKPAPVRKFNPQIPDGLQQIVDRLLAKDPAQRYPTPERAAQALKDYQASGPAQAALESEPRMQAYLQWLAVQPREDEDGPDLEPTPTPTPPAAEPQWLAVAGSPPAQAAGSPMHGIWRREWLVIAIGLVGAAAAVTVGWLLLHWLYG